MTHAPDPQARLFAVLADLDAVLDEAPALDDASRAALAAAILRVQAALAAAEEPAAPISLAEAAARFSNEHPSLAASIARLSQALGDSGV